MHPVIQPLSNLRRFLRRLCRSRKASEDRSVASTRPNARQSTARSLSSNSPDTRLSNQSMTVSTRSDESFLTSYVVADATDSATLGYLAGGSLPGSVLGAEAAEARLEHRAKEIETHDASTSVEPGCVASTPIDTSTSPADTTSSNSGDSWTCDSSSSLGASFDATPSASDWSSGSDSGSSDFDSGSSSW